MEFPMLVYISPGTHKAPGGTFDYLQVCDIEGLEEAMREGYYPTVDLAVAQDASFSWDEYADSQGWYKEASDDAPTREELEAKATELDIKFSANMKNETLLGKIEAALAEQE